MSNFEKPNPEDLDIQEAIREILEAPEWEGYTVPDINKVRRFLIAERILKKLIPDNENVTQVFSPPTPFHADCGGEIDIFADTARYSFAVFKNSNVVSKVSEFLSVVDSVSVTAERDDYGQPMIVISWSIFDVYVK